MFLYFCQKKLQKRQWKIYNYFHYQENIKLILFAQQHYNVKLMLKFCISIISDFNAELHVCNMQVYKKIVPYACICMQST